MIEDKDHQLAVIENLYNDKLHMNNEYHKLTMIKHDKDQLAMDNEYNQYDQLHMQIITQCEPDDLLNVQVVDQYNQYNLPMEHNVQITVTQHNLDMTIQDTVESNYNRVIIGAHTFQLTK